MKLPKHVNPQRDAALAPYNFVPLPEKVVTVKPEELPDQDIFDPTLRTGRIECTLMTESPLYVRAALTVDEFKCQETEADKKAPWREQVRNKPDFFYRDPEAREASACIPGSSLRGMLRSLVEVLGYGKMEYVTNRHLVYRAVGDTTRHGAEYRKRIMHEDGSGLNAQGKRCQRYTPRVQAGYIEPDGAEWYIRPAQEIGGVSFARIRIDNIPRGLEPVPGCPNAEYIYVQPGPYNYAEVRGGFLQIRMSKVLRFSATPGAGLQKCVLARSGYMGSKRSEAVVFPPDEGAPRIHIKEEMARDYLDQVSQEQDEMLGEHGVLHGTPQGNGKQEAPRNKGYGQPVFYLLDDLGELVFFGHTMMMRLPYLYSPLEYVPPALRREADIDLAEALFGYSKKKGDGKERAYAGRVSVSDAVLDSPQEDIWLLPERQRLTPKILGGPKPTTFQHYLVQQKPDAEEIGRTPSGQPKMQKQLADYASETPRDTVLRGHKLYWHQGAVSAGEIQEALEKLRKKDRDGRILDEENPDNKQHTQMRPVKPGVRFKFIIRFQNLNERELGAVLWALTLPGRPGAEHRHSLGMGKPYGMGAVKLKPKLWLDDPAGRYGTLLDEQNLWHSATREAGADEIERLARTFDEFMVSQVEPGKGKRLAEVERIAMLLKLLEWPGPNRRLTRYLEIEHPDPNARHGKLNEYLGRPVLPDPLGAAAMRPPVEIPPAQGARSPQGPRFGQAQQAPGQRSGQGVQPRRAESGGAPGGSPGDRGAAPQRPGEQAGLAAQPPRRSPVTLSTPGSAAELEPGMYVEGKVKRVEPERVVVEICGEECTLPRQAVAPLIRDTGDERERFPAGRLIRVWVKGRNKAGRVQLTMVRP